MSGCPEDQICSQRTRRCVSPDVAYGETCFSGRDCHAGMCLPSGPDAVSGFCSGDCGAGEPPCPDTMACVPFTIDSAGTLDRFCAPAGMGATGDACSVGESCTGGMCLPFTDDDTLLTCTGLCDTAVADDCGTGNVACVPLPDNTGQAILTDGDGEELALCVAGGVAAPGQACPGGLLDCDLSQSDICLQSTDGTITLCGAPCEDDAGCGELIAGGCCVDLGTTETANFCLPPAYCGCTPNCLGKQCGDDGCGFSCGSCGSGQSCQGGVCVACTPDCTGKVCGDNGCGGECGTCDSGQICRSGACEATCTPDCGTNVCGDDGCGGLCGTCTDPAVCYTGACVDPSLLLKEIIVRDPALTPPDLWGLGEFTSPQSVGPPVVYLDGPQAGTTQRLMCGTDIVCSDLSALVAETPYELVLGYDIGAGRVRCTATFTLHDGAAATVDGADCLTGGGGPFATVTVEGGPATPSFGWTLP